MGGIWMSRHQFASAASEFVGQKAGLVLSEEEMARLLPSEMASQIFPADDQITRLRAEAFEELAVRLLYEVGNISSPDTGPAQVRLFHKFQHSPASAHMLVSVWKLLLAFVAGDPDQIINADGILALARVCLPDVIANLFFSKTHRRDEFYSLVTDRYKNSGYEVAQELIDNLRIDIHKTPFVGYRRFEWKDEIQLRELFRSESLEPMYGHFIDQRFIDYLDRHFEDIDKMNWRKFEGLVCEFFERNGCTVQIGEGRGDGGVDARVWSASEDKSLPPSILVQCKRQKEKVEQVIVKALWADVDAEGADSGLIVTTSSLEPAARRVRETRSYPIFESNRDSVRRWLKTLRTPDNGVFMGV